MKLYSKTICIIIILTLTFTCTPFISSVFAEAPYRGYNYSYWENSDPSPIPYLPDLIIDGREESYGTFSSPEDFFVTEAEEIYILDTGNNRIVVLNDNFDVITIISEFQNGSSKDSFNQPQGIYVTEDSSIYVADTNNQRIVELTTDGEFIREIGAPTSNILRAGFEFYPVKIAVDKAERIYVIGRGVFEGIIEFDSDGDFTGFTGANRVTFNPIDYLWRVLATREQRERMSLFIPIEFNNLDLDDEGFIYTTNSERNSSSPVQRLNPTGTDVLRKEGYHDPTGDIIINFTGDSAGGSTFIDVHVNEYGMYSVLDINKGRIFTYDEDGNLLYIFGQLGNQRGTFRTPVAIGRMGENILVLDKGFNRITLFKPTEFGTNVNQAVMHYNKGNDQESATYWAKALRLNANYEVAYVGIGKALLMEGRNDEAMEFFEHGHSRQYYSKAYKRYRQEVLRANFGTMMTFIISIPLLMIAIKYSKHRMRKRKGGSHAK